MCVKMGFEGEEISHHVLYSSAIESSKKQLVAMGTYLTWLRATSHSELDILKQSLGCKS